MGVVAESALSLRFFGDDLDPQELSELLGAQPTQGARKGDLQTGSNGQKRILKCGSWLMTSARREPADLDSQIYEIFGQLTDDMAVWHDLTSRFSADVFIGLFLEASNDGISISPAALHIVASRGLKVDFNIYCNCEECEV